MLLSAPLLTIAEAARHCAVSESTIRRDVIDLGTNTKTGRPRRIPIVRQLRPYLRYVPWASPLSRLEHAALLARRAAGLGHVHLHDLRHTTASLLAQVGVPLFEIGVILGHTSPATTARYAHLCDEQTRATMGKLERALGAGVRRA